MQSSSPVYLHVPVSVSLSGMTMPGSLSIPRTAAALGVCIEHPGQERDTKRLIGDLARVGLATLTVRAEETLSLGDMVSLIDWVRSRRLLRALPIGVIAPGAEGAAALKAAQHRPVAVPAVLVMRPDSTSMPSALRWLRRRLLAASKSECRLSVAYSA
jgi:hypothetical protein